MANTWAFPRPSNAYWPVKRASRRSMKEAAAVLNVSARTVDSLTTEGALKSLLVGRLRRYDRRDLEAFIEWQRDAEP